MEQTEHLAFQATLGDLQTYFREDLTPRNRELYWLLLRDLVTLAEWTYACEQAMLRETFPHVPLVAQLLDYVREYRRTERGKRLEAAWTEGVASRATLHEMQERIGTEKRVGNMVDEVLGGLD